MSSLVADIGGTNARFGIAEKTKITNEKVYPTKDFAQPREAIQEYLSGLGVKPEHACIAVACPVHKSPIQLTNSHWRFYKGTLKKDLGLKSLDVINDFTALSLAIPLMNEEDYVGFGSGSVIENSPIGVLGPGTGLGMSGLIPMRVSSGKSSGSEKDKTSWFPIQGEGGHISYAPQTALEFEVVKILAQELPRISAERILTGTGLQRIYRALCIINDVPSENLDAQHIVEAAIKKTDDSCRSAFDIFACALGDVAGDLGLVLGAFGGIYIGGGIVSKHYKSFIKSGLRRRFENKGRFDSYMRDIPTFIIKSDLSALRGCALYLDRKEY